MVIDDVPATESLIDCHTHLGPTWVGTEPMTAEGMLEWMELNGVDQVILLPLESPSAASYYSTTRSILDIADDHSGRFIPFCSFDPRVDLGIGGFVESRREGYRQLLEQYVERGARGFGEVKCKLPIDDERMQLLYELCGDYDLPILIHLDGQSMMDGVGFPGLERMLTIFPDTDFIMHSHGWWTHMSGDVEPEDLDRGAMPDSPIAEGGRCEALLKQYDNIYGDISAGSGWNALIRDEEYTQGFLERHHEQLIFGTDKSYMGFRPSQFELFDRFPLSADARENIAHRNIRGLLQI